MPSDIAGSYYFTIFTSADYPADEALSQSMLWIRIFLQNWQMPYTSFGNALFHLVCTYVFRFFHRLQPFIRNLLTRNFDGQM